MRHLSVSDLRKKIPFARFRLLVLIFLFFFFFKGFLVWDSYFRCYGLDDLLIYLHLPSNGADSVLEHKIIKRCLVEPLLWAVGFCMLPELTDFLVKTASFVNTHCTTLKKHYTQLLTYAFTVLLIVVTIGHNINCPHITLSDLKNFFNRPTSDFYEKNFHAPNTDNVTLSLQKKNLLLIQIESMEHTFEDENFFKVSLIPHLKQLKSVGTSFRHYHNGFATSYTQGSLIAMYTGLPTNYIARDFMNRNGNRFNFLPDYNTLSDILRQNGYATFFIQGGDGTFAGTSNFLRTHGVTAILDRTGISRFYSYAQIAGGWGYGDRDVLEIASEKLQKRKRQQPWFMHIQTVDTHFNYQPKINGGVRVPVPGFTAHR
jgi:hypothetical protein